MATLWGGCWIIIRWQSDPFREKVNGRRRARDYLLRLVSQLAWHEQGVTSVAIHYGRDDVKESSHVHTRQISAAVKMSTCTNLFFFEKKKLNFRNLRAGAAAAWHDEGHSAIFDAGITGDLGSEHVVAAWLRTAACANNAATRHTVLCKQEFNARAGKSC